MIGNLQASPSLLNPPRSQPSTGYIQAKRTANSRKKKVGLGDGQIVIGLRQDRQPPALPTLQLVEGYEGCPVAFALGYTLSPLPIIRSTRSPTRAQP